jgi:hypothetical protein
MLFCVFLWLSVSVSDPHSLPVYADPDPAFLTKADPDLNPGLKLANFFQSDQQFHVFVK